MNIFFPINFLDTSIKGSGCLDAIILWLCQCYSTRLECTQVVFRIAVILFCCYKILLEISSTCTLSRQYNLGFP